MSTTTLGDGNKLFKGAIRQYFVESLLQELEKLHTSTTNTKMQVCIQNESTEIRKEVEQMTNFLIAIDEWENRVFDSFSMIKRCTSRKMSDDSRRKMVGNILVEIKELKKVAPNIITFRTVDATPDKPLKGGKSEVGESSNSNVKDTSSMKNDVSLEKFNAEQKELLCSLAIFPENIEVKKRLLVNWWIGLGLLPYEGDTSVMENQYVDMFQKLEEMNILKPKRVREHNKVVDSYTIDPTIHKQFISYLKKENRVIESEETKGLRLYKNDKDEVVAVLNLNKLHLSSHINIEPTIKVVQLGEWRYIDLEVHNKNMETIHDVAGTKFLENMAEAVTYLSLRGISRIQELPHSIGKMRGLKILDLKDCHSLQQLPQKPKSKVCVGVSSDDGWFKELKHLDITGCYLLYHMPKWVCELSNLQVLKGAVFNGFIPEGEEPCRLKDISKLQKLQKLSIKIINPHLLSPDDCTGLKQLSSLLVLTIAWGRCGTSEQINSVSVEQGVATKKQSKGNSRGKMLGGAIKGDEKMKEKEPRKKIHGENEDGMTTPTIYFPENLEKLDIRCYPNAKAPELLDATMLQKLRRLYIRGGKLTTLGDDVGWQAKILRLRFMKYLNLSRLELRYKFTKLEYVEYYECPRLSNFPKSKSSWSKEIDGPFSTHPDSTGPFNNDEPIPPEYSEPVTLRLANSYIDEDQAVASLELTLMAAMMSVSDLVMVLDIGRSMEGEKLAIMKAAMLHFIKNLTYFSGGVRLSIVTFGIYTKGCWPLRLITENRLGEIETLFKYFVAGGSTSASDGLQMGLKVLNARTFRRGRIPTILLVSGSKNINDAAQVPTGNVIIHTVGIGHDYDGEVLQSIAAKSGGRFTDASNYFWLNWKVDYCIDNLTLSFTPIRGAPIVQLVNRGAWDSRGAYLPSDHNTIRVYYGSLHIYNEFPKMRVILPHHSDVAEICYSYKFKGVQFETYWRLYREGPDVKIVSQQDDRFYSIGR